jgi:hypothetical protein
MRKPINPKLVRYIRLHSKYDSNEVRGAVGNAKKC